MRPIRLLAREMCQTTSCPAVHATARGTILVQGHVVDYVLFHTPVWSFAVFNLADALITVGAALVIIEELLIWRAARRREEPSGD